MIENTIILPLLFLLAVTVYCFILRKYHASMEPSRLYAKQLKSARVELVSAQAEQESAASRVELLQRRIKRLSKEVSNVEV